MINFFLEIRIQAALALEDVVGNSRHFELTLKADEISFGYRTCSLADDTVVVEAVLKGRPGVRAEIESQMDSFVTRRERTQPGRPDPGCCAGETARGRSRMSPSQTDLLRPDNG